MNVLIGIVAYLFGVINTAFSVLWFWRDDRKEMKMRALIISETALHVLLIIILLVWWLNGKTL